MRGYQAGFDFGEDIFDFAGFTQSTLEDFETREQKRREREAAEELKRKREREWAEEDRRQREQNRRWESKDPWEVLAVSRGASKQTIRATWATLCKQYHPDNADGDEYKIRMINAAYNKLKVWVTR